MGASGAVAGGLSCAAGEHPARKVGKLNLHSSFAPRSPPPPNPHSPPPTPRSKKADEYLAHFVGHEGAGSLLSALKARGWASELSAGVADQSSVCWLFEVSITLTEAGLAAGPGESCRRAWWLAARAGAQPAALRARRLPPYHPAPAACLAQPNPSLAPTTQPPHAMQGTAWARPRCSLSIWLCCARRGHSAGRTTSSRLSPRCASASRWVGAGRGGAQQRRAWVGGWWVWTAARCRPPAVPHPPHSLHTQPIHLHPPTGGGGCCGVHVRPRLRPLLLPAPARASGAIPVRRLGPAAGAWDGPECWGWQ